MNKETVNPIQNQPTWPNAYGPPLKPWSPL